MAINAAYCGKIDTIKIEKAIEKLSNCGNINAPLIRSQDKGKRGAGRFAD